MTHRSQLMHTSMHINAHQCTSMHINVYAHHTHIAINAHQCVHINACTSMHINAHRPMHNNAWMHNNYSETIDSKHTN